MSVEWSPDDTKAELLAACEELGIEANERMLKADIIAALEAVTEDDDEDEVMTSAEKKADAYTADASFTGEPKPPIPDPPKPTPPKRPKSKSVLDLLKESQGQPVPLGDLVKKLGKGAVNEVKRLLAEGKVSQHRRGNKFWFVANG